MSEYIQSAGQQVVSPAPYGRPVASLQLTAQPSEANWPLRISAGVISIAVGFWGGSAALAPHSMSSMLGPRFAWLGFLLAFAALCAVISGFTEIVRPRLKDLRVPSLSVPFASLNVLGHVAVFIAFPIVTPMLGGLTASALGIVLITLTMFFDAWPPTAP
jgi:hypothetical protein